MNTEQAVEKTINVMRRKHMAFASEQSYTGWLRRFARFVSERSPEGTPAQKMEAFLSQLTRQRGKSVV